MSWYDFTKISQSDIQTPTVMCGIIWEGCEKTDTAVVERRWTENNRWKDNILGREIECYTEHWQIELKEILELLGNGLNKYRKDNCEEQKS